MKTTQKLTENKPLEVGRTESVSGRDYDVRGVSPAQFPCVAESPSIDGLESPHPMSSRIVHHMKHHLDEIRNVLSKKVEILKRAITTLKVVGAQPLSVSDKDREIFEIVFCLFSGPFQRASDAIHLLEHAHTVYPREMDFFIPQLAVYLLYGPHESAELLLSVLLQICRQSCSFAHKLYYFISSFVLSEAGVNAAGVKSIRRLLVRIAAEGETSFMSTAVGLGSLEYSVDQSSSCFVSTECSVNNEINTVTTGTNIREVYVSMQAVSALQSAAPLSPNFPSDLHVEADSGSFSFDIGPPNNQQNRRDGWTTKMRGVQSIRNGMQTSAGVGSTPTPTRPTNSFYSTKNRPFRTFEVDSTPDNPTTPELTNTLQSNGVSRSPAVPLTHRLSLDRAFVSGIDEDYQLHDFLFSNPRLVSKSVNSFRDFKTTAYSDEGVEEREGEGDVEVCHHAEPLETPHTGHFYSTTLFWEDMCRISRFLGTISR